MWRNPWFITDVDKKIEKICYFIILLEVCFLIFGYCTNNNNITLFMYNGIFLVVFVWFFLVFERLSDGYKIEKNDIFYRKKFIAHNIKYADIKAVVISNAVFPEKSTTPIGRYKIINKRLRFEVYPWVSILNEIPKTKHNSKLLYSTQVFRLVNKNSILYGFAWNQKSVSLFLAGYKGKYYIADSVMKNYTNTISNICEVYNITKDRLVIITEENY